MVYVYIFHVVFSIAYLEIKHLFPPNVYSRKKARLILVLVYFISCIL